jgi:hypothetical protein
VTGAYAVEPDGAEGDSAIVVAPSEPPWAARRPLRVQLAATAAGHRVTTRIG